MQKLSIAQLVKESKCCQEIAGLLKLYLLTESNSNCLIPILTSAQLKMNALKNAIEGLINEQITQDQGCRKSDSEDPLDEMILNSKSENELLQLLAVLRDKECQWRINLNFSPYSSQKTVVQAQLTNFQRKICQIERELKRRRECFKAVRYN